MFSMILQTLTAFARTRRGVTTIEYAIIASLIGAMIVGALTSIGGDLSATFNSAANNL